MRIRLAEEFMHGDRHVAVLDGWACARLNKLGFDRLREQAMGRDAHLYQLLLAIRTVAMKYEGSPCGTNAAPQREPMRQSLKNQQLNTDTVGTTNAATILGLTPRAVRRAIEEKRLAATLLDGRYRITRDDLAEFAAHR